MTIEEAKAEIKTSIDELYENGKCHAIFVRNNGELVIEGLRMALEILNQVEPDYKTIEDEVWDFARRIICPSDCCEDSISKYTEKFLGIPSHKTRAIFKDLSYQEVKDRYEAWKKEKEKIHVGDEVDIDGEITVVTMVNEYGEVLSVDCDGMTYYYNVESQLKRAKKTGRHFPEVTELLKKMRGELNHENKL